MTGWSEERVTQLKALWQGGDSASIIAAKLPGNFTRSAVLGKIHRLEIADSQRRVPTKRKEVEQSSKSPPARREPSPPRLPVVSRVRALRPAPRLMPMLEAPVPTGKVTILQLSNKTCKWPIGDPGTEDFCFCGHKPRDGSPYCEYHAQKAVAPIQPKRFSPSAFQNVGRKVVAHVG